jgi:hypothetical protein
LRKPRSNSQDPEAVALIFGLVLVTLMSLLIGIPLFIFLGFIIYAKYELIFNNPEVPVFIKVFVYCTILVICWSFAKRRLVKFQGIPQLTFYLHLKECEFRFNYRNQNLYVILLKMIRENSLF